MGTAADVFKPGDEFVAADDLELGSIVWFERAGDARVIAHVATSAHLSSFSIPLFVLHPGTGPGSIRFRQLRLEDVP